MLQLSCLTGDHCEMADLVSPVPSQVSHELRQLSNERPSLLQRKTQPAIDLQQLQNDTPLDLEPYLYTPSAFERVDSPSSVGIPSRQYS